MAEDDLVEALKALAHPLRWRILSSLAGAERNVGEIEQATGIGQPALSQQLGVLRKAGLVTTRKAAKLVFYALARSEITAIRTAIETLEPSDQTVRQAAIAAQSERTPAPGVANFARLS